MDGKNDQGQKPNSRKFDERFSSFSMSMAKSSSFKTVDTPSAAASLGASLLGGVWIFWLAKGYSICYSFKMVYYRGLSWRGDWFVWGTLVVWMGLGRCFCDMNLW